MDDESPEPMPEPLSARAIRQEANRQDARVKLAALIEEAQVEPNRRARTPLNRVGKAERLKVKKARGAVKANRGKPKASDW